MKIAALIALGLAVRPAAAHDCVAPAEARGAWTCVESGSGELERTSLIADQEALDAFLSGRGAPALQADFAAGGVEASYSSLTPSFRLVRSARSEASATARREASAGELLLAAARMERVAGSVRFDRLGASDAAASGWTMGSGEARLIRTQATCTQGVDCPESAAGCTQGVDCPGDGYSSGGADCTQGVDCPGDGSYGGGVPPPAPPYRARPTAPPSAFPPVGTPQYYDEGVTSAGYWVAARDILGRPTEVVGQWTNSTGRGTISRGGSEVGQQAAAYNVPLRSESSRGVYRLHWRYVGTNCDPNDTNRCLNWGVQYGYLRDRTEAGAVTAIVLNVAFADDQPLLPWERDVVNFAFDGTRVTVDQSGAAFAYGVRQNGASMTLTRGARNRRRIPQAEEGRVAVSLVKNGSTLELVVDDSRAAFFAGEAIELDVKVTQVCARRGMLNRCIDEDVFVRGQRQGGFLRVPVAAGRTRQIAVPVGTAPGEYFIGRLLYRRVGGAVGAQSRLVSDEWIRRPDGPRVRN